MMVLLFKKFSYLNKKPRNKLAFSILGKKEKLDIPCSANKLTHSRLNEKYYFIFFLLGNTMTVWFFFSTEQSCIICYGENRHADMNKKQYATKHSWENLTTHIHIHYVLGMLVRCVARGSSGADYKLRAEYGMIKLLHATWTHRRRKSCNGKRKHGPKLIVCHICSGYNQMTLLFYVGRSVLAIDVYRRISIGRRVHNGLFERLQCKVRRFYNTQQVFCLYVLCLLDIKVKICTKL